MTLSLETTGKTLFHEERGRIRGKLLTVFYCLVGDKGGGPKVHIPGPFRGENAERIDRDRWDTVLGGTFAVRTLAQNQVS
jgi:hypothetical protein